jgi:predicted anti-sigma-YlaC factor YlaD
MMMVIVAVIIIITWKRTSTPDALLQDKIENAVQVTDENVHRMNKSGACIGTEADMEKEDQL